MSQNIKTGRKGEDIAAKYLQSKGYSIRHTNWRQRKAELDLVVEKEALLVVVEVKTRSYEMDFDPRDLVPPIKQAHIIRATNQYLDAFELDVEVRFDIVLLQMKNSDTKLEHIEDAFYPEVG